MHVTHRKRFVSRDLVALAARRPQELAALSEAHYREQIESIADEVLAAGQRLAPVIMAAQALVTTGPQACLEGAQYLAKMPDVRQNLGTLLEIFSDNEAATELIRPEGNRITATLGCDLDPAMPGACIVSKRYLAGGGLTGSVAIIGSTRMEYQRLLPILDYFAAKLGQSMAGQGQ